jgi:hypothetical protein
MPQPPVGATCGRPPSSAGRPQVAPTETVRPRWDAEPLLLALTIVIAAGIRLYWGVQPRIVWGDEPFYLWLGQSLLSGRGYQFFGISGVHFSPLFPLLGGVAGRIASLFGLQGPDALAAGSVSLYVLCGAALVLPLSAIARRLYGPVAGLFTALATALYPALTAGIPLWGTMTEPLYLLLLASAWWALLTALDAGRLAVQRRACLAAGALLGLAYLTRTEALVYLPVGLTAVIFLARGPARGRIRFALVNTALAVAVFLLVISPYLLALHAETGQWQLAEEAGSTYVSAQGLATGDMAAFDRATWGLDPASGEVYLFSPASEDEGLLDAILARPVAFLRIVRANLADLGRTLVSLRLVPWLLLVVICLGLFSQPWDGPRGRRELLLAAAFVGPLSFLPFFIQDRYIAPALIPALVWLGGGLAWLAGWLRASGEGLLLRPVRGWPCALAVALVLSGVLLIQGRQVRGLLGHTQSFQPGHLTAAATLAAAGVTSETVVMSRYPAVAFHSGATWIPTPAADWTDVAAYAARKAAQFLVVDAAEVALRPQLAFLLDPNVATAGLTRVATFGVDADEVIVYAFR